MWVAAFQPPLIGPAIEPGSTAPGHFSCCHRNCHCGNSPAQPLPRHHTRDSRQGDCVDRPQRVRVPGTFCVSRSERITTDDTMSRNSFRAPNTGFLMRAVASSAQIKTPRAPRLSHAVHWDLLSEGDAVIGRLAHLERIPQRGLRHRPCLSLLYDSKMASKAQAEHNPRSQRSSRRSKRWIALTRLQPVSRPKAVFS